MAQRLVQLQDLVNKATEGKRVAAIRDASIKAKDALAIASTKYTPGYTSPLDIADVSPSPRLHQDRRRTDNVIFALTAQQYHSLFS